MTKVNEVEVYKRALGTLTQQVGKLTLDLALAQAQLEEMHTQLTEASEEDAE